MVNGLNVDFLNHYLESQKPATGNRRRSSLNKFLQFAIAQKIIYSNPPELPDKVESTTHSKNNIPYNYLTQDQIAKIMDHVPEDRRIFLVVLLALNTGADVGEILGIRTRNIRRFKKGQAIIKLTPPRSGERDVKVDGPAASLVRELFQSDQEFLFYSGRKKRRPSESGHLHRIWAFSSLRNYAKKIGIPNTTPRILRNTFIMNFAGNAEQLSEFLMVNINAAHMMISRKQITLQEAQLPQIPDP